MDFRTIENSSNLAAAGYDEESGELIVEFKNGSRYAYPESTEDDLENLLGAESPGRHFHQNIRARKSRKIVPEPEAEEAA